MSVYDGAKKIIQYLLERAIQNGSLNTRFSICYDKLAKDTGLDNEGFCHVCCQYLYETRCVELYKNDDESRTIELKAKAIDFLEHSI